MQEKRTIRLAFAQDDGRFLRISSDFDRRPEVDGYQRNYRNARMILPPARARMEILSG